MKSSKQILRGRRAGRARAAHAPATSWSSATPPPVAMTKDQVADVFLGRNLSMVSIDLPEARRCAPPSTRRRPTVTWPR